MGDLFMQDSLFIFYFPEGLRLSESRLSKKEEKTVCRPMTSKVIGKSSAPMPPESPASDRILMNTPMARPTTAYIASFPAPRARIDSVC